MYLLALLFTLAYCAISYLNLARMIHGAPSFPILALVYLPLSIGVTWLVARRLAKSTWNSISRLAGMLAIGIALCAIGSSLWWIALSADLASEARKDAAVQVTQTEESIFRSKAGNPIGLKLVFTARVPKDGYYSFRKPNMGLSDESFQDMRTRVSGSWPLQALVMETYRTEVTPPASSGKFEEGVTYTLTYFLIPSYVVDSATEPMPCIWVSQDFPMEQWERMLNSDYQGTYELAPIIGAYEPRAPTRGRYSQKMFFDGIRKEGLAFCPPKGRSPDRLSAFPGIL